MKLIAIKHGRSQRLDRLPFIRAGCSRGIESPAVLAGAFERTFAPGAG
jgi:hypothetical protein